MSCQVLSFIVTHEYSGLHSVSCGDASSENVRTRQDCAGSCRTEFVRDADTSSNAKSNEHSEERGCLCQADDRSSRFE